MIMPGTHRSIISFAFSLLSLIAFLSVPVLTRALSTTTEKVLHSFASYPHGYNPNSPLIADPAGNLYGTAQGGAAGIVFELSPGANGTWTQTVLHNFSGSSFGGPDGAYPNSIIFDGAGNLYGTTFGGGTFGKGTVFRMIPSANGWKEAVLYSFAGPFADGAYPGPLTLDSSGNLYGTTSQGGNSLCYDQYSQQYYGCGIAYELSPNSDGTWSETILYNFQEGADGGDPTSTLVLDKSGNLYGTANYGGYLGNGCEFLDGGGGCGVLFRLSKANGVWTETVLYTFLGTTSDGSAPPAGVVFDAQDNLYGLGYPGLIEFSPTSQGTWTPKLLYTLNLYAFGLPSFDSAGNVYGTSFNGGISSSSCNGGCGTIFELSPNGVGGWTATTLYAFTGGNDGAEPMGMLRTASGNLFATNQAGGIPKCLNSYGCGAIFELAPNSSGTWSGSVVYDFPLSSLDGGTPYSNLVADAAGNLYGTTTRGGSSNFGTVFKMSVNAKGMWQSTVLYSFTNANGDGAIPQAGLISDVTGNLYGTTTYGGNKCSCGVVFRLSPASHGTWTETVLYGFQPGSNTKDGSEPAASLVSDGAGKLYGTTAIGGESNYGTVFELSPTSSGVWNETILYSFGADGVDPTSRVIFDKQGNLYGTVGDVITSHAPGAVYELSPPSVGTQWTETLLYSFTSTTDGENPIGGVVFDAAGNLYGVADYGGPYYVGEIFKLMPTSGGTWSKSTVHSFTDVNGDGAFPRAGLIIDGSGNLYGTTEGGGLVSGYGMAFEFSPVSGGQWREIALHRFSGGSDGALPLAALLLDSHGNIYGTTSSGGGGYQGVVFEIKP